MLDFIIIGQPRSGTTWASNWFTTDQIHCVHDPLYTKHYSDWDKAFSFYGKLSGVSCTGIWRWPEWVNSHSAKKLVIHRNLDEIASSMQAIGLPVHDLEEAEQKLSSIHGIHIQMDELFDQREAALIWELVTGIPFNKERHQALVEIEMQPKFSGLKVSPSVTRKLMDELTNIALGGDE